MNRLFKSNNNEIDKLKNSKYFCGIIIGMQVVSELVEIKNNGKPTTEYIGQELTKLNINPLRWAIVSVSDTIFKVSVANLKE